MNSAALLGHYALTLYRTLTRQWLYALLNILGLSVGIAVFLVLWLDVRFETGFERWIPNVDQIYQLRTSFPGLGIDPTNNTMGAMIDLLKGDYPKMVATRVWDQDGTVRQGAEVTSEKVEVVDPDFFQVFDVPLVAGDASTALRSPDDMLISQTVAHRYFGAADPIGRRLDMTVLGAANAYRVAGVLKDPPADTDIPFKVIIPFRPIMTVAQPYWREWGSQEVYTYVRLKTPTAAAALDRDLDPFIDRHVPREPDRPRSPFVTLRTTPLTAMHLINPKDAIVVAGLGAVGLLTLLLAGVNYVNLATARAGLRAREVGLRKVMGATRGALMAQFLGEALASAFVAALIGLAICELALPMVNAAGGLALKVDYLGRDSIVGPALVAVAAIGLGAGVYPALVLSRFQPAAVLASARAPGGGRAGVRVREGLVIVQFAIAIAFTIATAVIVSQTIHLRSADLGFHRDGLVVINSIDDDQVTAAQRASVLEAWRAAPGVMGVTTADIAPGNDNNTSQAGFRRAGAKDAPNTLHVVETGPDFLETYGARLIAGRGLDRNHGADDTQPSSGPPDPNAPPAPIVNVVINASAARTLGFRTPQAAIGQEIQEGRRKPRFATVVGVIQDIRFRTPRAPVPPTIYLFTTRDFGSAVAGVRYAGADPHAIMDELAARWRRIAPDTPFHGATVEENLLTYYRPADQHGRLFTMGAVLAVLIGCLGLYGMASFNTARRVKEIGIRKTLGASTRDILRLLIGQFLRPVLLANLAAWPLAWLAMRGWLSSFDQRIALSPVYFLAATLLTLLIAIATVAGQALAVARAEPARALRHE